MATAATTVAAADTKRPIPSATVIDRRTRRGVRGTQHLSWLAANFLLGISVYSLLTNQKHSQRVRPASVGRCAFLAPSTKKFQEPSSLRTKFFAHYVLCTMYIPKWRSFVYVGPLLRQSAEPSTLHLARFTAPLRLGIRDPSRATQQLPLPLTITAHHHRPSAFGLALLLEVGAPPPPALLQLHR